MWKCRIGIHDWKETYRYRNPLWDDVDYVCRREFCSAIIDDRWEHTSRGEWSLDSEVRAEQKRARAKEAERLRNS